MNTNKFSVVFGILGLAWSTACGGSDGAAGAQGADGAPGAAGPEGKVDVAGAAGLVSPSKGILDREIEVQIGGSGTRFGEGARPEFGEGVTVVESYVSSPTLVIAKIRIGKDAKIGKRDVKVGDVVAKGAFEVIPAIVVKTGATSGAKVPQGGIVQFTVENNDSRAFDPSTLSLLTPGFVDLGTGADTAQVATGLLLAPPLLKAGKSQVSLANLDEEGKPRVSFVSAPDALEVTSRVATPFPFDEPKTETFGASLETKLYKTESKGASILDYRIEVPEGSETAPFAFVFGAGGTDADQVASMSPPQSPFGGSLPPPYDLHAVVPVRDAAAGTHFVVLVDASGSSGAAKVTAASVPATIVAEAAAPHDATAPAPVAFPETPGLIVDGELKAKGEVDAYKLTVADGDTLQVGLSSGADVQVIVTKDPAVLSDPSGTQPANRKVLATFSATAKATGNRIVALAGQRDVFVVARAVAGAAAATGKYAVTVRKNP